MFSGPIFRLRYLLLRHSDTVIAAPCSFHEGWLSNAYAPEQRTTNEHIDLVEGAYAMSKWQIRFANVARRLLLALAFLAYTSVGQAAPGFTEFWLAPPNVTFLNNVPGGEPIYLVTIAGDTAATVTIDQPANGAFTPIVQAITPHTSVRTNLTAFKAALKTTPTNTVLNSGLHISSTAPVTAYYEIANTDNTDMLTLKGADALGQEFYIPLHKHAPFFNEPSYASPEQAIASFDIVASQNGTTVSIYSPVPVDGHPALQQFSLTLNRGQTYSAGYSGSNWSVPANHPSGAVVLADKPVAVSIKDDSVHNPSGGCTNLQSDQLVPVGALGMDYIAVKGAINSNGDESVVIIATRNDTQIHLDGAATPAATLFAGEYYRVDMDYLAASSDNAVYIHATQPIYAAHISGFGCEAGLALLPRIDVGGSADVDFVRDDAQSFFLMLVSPAAAVNAFTITGAGTATIDPGAFVTVPGTGNAWKAARIAFDTTQAPVDTPMRVSNSAGFFALGTLNGGATTGARYGYFSRFADQIGFALTVSAMPGAIAEPGGTVTFSVHVANAGDAPATLAAIGDNFLGDLDARGTCSVPQTIAPAAAYDCGFARVVSGSLGDIQTETVTASGTSLNAAISAAGSATVTITDVIFADGFE